MGGSRGADHHVEPLRKKFRRIIPKNEANTSHHVALVASFGARICPVAMVDGFETEAEKRSCSSGQSEASDSNDQPEYTTCASPPC